MNSGRIADDGEASSGFKDRSMQWLRAQLLARDRNADARSFDSELQREEVPMFSEAQSLRQLFHKIVADCYERYTGMHDTELTSYVADLLTDFADLDQLYRLRDEKGAPIEELSRMLAASDPVYGTAPSFLAERAIRKHIGDYSLFQAGMYPEIFRSPHHDEGELYQEIVHAGQSSYYVVSQFNVFEYAAEAPLFARLAENFELCVYGLNKVRCEFERLCLLSANAAPALQEQAI